MRLLDWLADLPDGLGVIFAVVVPAASISLVLWVCGVPGLYAFCAALFIVGIFWQVMAWRSWRDRQR